MSVAAMRVDAGGGVFCSIGTRSGKLPRGGGDLIDRGVMGIGRPKRAVSSRSKLARRWWPWALVGGRY